VERLRIGQVITNLENLKKLTTADLDAFLKLGGNDDNPYSEDNYYDLHLKGRAEGIQLAIDMLKGALHQALDTVETMCKTPTTNSTPRPRPVIAKKD
jgi:hypothetical protein